MTRLIRISFLIFIIAAFIFATLDKALWSNFFLRGGLTLDYVIKMAWLDWKYWAWLLLGILVIRKNPWGWLVLLTVVPGNISYFYGVYFISGHFRNIDWYANLIAAFSAMTMVVLGVIYYGMWFIQSRQQNKH